VRITAGWSVGRRPDPAARAEPGAEADELTAELTASYWRAHDQRLAETGFFAIARQLPGLIGQAIRLGWEANRRDTVATIGLNLVSGILTGFALLATNSVPFVPMRTGGYPRRAPGPSRRTSTGSPRMPSPSPIPAPASLPCAR
jgi:ATP-binding cassette subfamily B protein/ATP-binding cassette subfamily C protein